MRTKSFELEQTVPGAFFFQGVAGGMLAGFVCILSLVLRTEPPEPVLVLAFTLLYLMMGATVGVFLATLLWGAHRITRIQLRAPARVAVTTVLVALGAWFVQYKAGLAVDRPFAIGVGIAWFTALPVALLVGSRVKPWQLFTFGSIAIDGYGNRWRSNSLWATFGTLPLRFLSLFALVCWILLFACKRQDERDVVELVVTYGGPLIYLLLTVYVSFRSPRKLVLLFIGLLLNVPVGFGAYISNTIDPKDSPWVEDVSTIINFCSAFLIVWTVFLAARLSVRTKLRSNFDAVVAQCSNEPDHQCLGSRFVEWRERAA